jgi:hypothetical protein
MPLPLASRFPKAAMASSAIEDAVSKPEWVESETDIPAARLQVRPKPNNTPTGYIYSVNGLVG